MYAQLPASHAVLKSHPPAMPWAMFLLQVTFEEQRLSVVIAPSASEAGEEPYKLEVELYGKVGGCWRRLAVGSRATCHGLGNGTGLWALGVSGLGMGAGCSCGARGMADGEQQVRMLGPRPNAPACLRSPYLPHRSSQISAGTRC